MSLKDYIEQNYNDLAEEYVSDKDISFDKFCREIFNKEKDRISDNYDEWFSLEKDDLIDSFIDNNYKDFEEYCINTCVD